VFKRGNPICCHATEREEKGREKGEKDPLKRGTLVADGRTL